MRAGVKLRLFVLKRQRKRSVAIIAPTTGEPTAGVAKGIVARI